MELAKEVMKVDSFFKSRVDKFFVRSQDLRLELDYMVLTNSLSLSRASSAEASSLLCAFIGYLIALKKCKKINLFTLTESLYNDKQKLILWSKALTAEDGENGGGVSRPRGQSRRRGAGGARPPQPASSSGFSQMLDLPLIQDPLLQLQVPLARRTTTIHSSGPFWEIVGCWMMGNSLRLSCIAFCARSRKLSHHSRYSKQILCAIKHLDEFNDTHKGCIDGSQQSLFLPDNSCKEKTQVFQSFWPCWGLRACHSQGDSHDGTRKKSCQAYS